MAYPSQYDNKMEVKHWQQLQNQVSYFWLRASNDLEPVIMEYKQYKMGFNHFWIFVTFQCRGLHYLDMYCTLII